MRQPVEPPGHAIAEGSGWLEYTRGAPGVAGDAVVFAAPGRRHECRPHDSQKRLPDGTVAPHAGQLLLQIGSAGSTEPGADAGHTATGRTATSGPPNPATSGSITAGRTDTY
jgi:hypothetical protein